MNGAERNSISLDFKEARFIEYNWTERSVVQF